MKITVRVIKSELQAEKVFCARNNDLVLFMDDLMLNLPPEFGTPMPH